MESSPVYWLGIVKRFCLTNLLDISIIVLAAIFFGFMYTTDPLSPHLSNGLGWMTYFDQSAYLRQAHAMADFNISQYYLYGLGYPLMAVPFIWIGMDGSGAFFAFDVFAYVAVVWAIYRFMKTVVDQRLAIISSLALMFATPLIGYTVQPWNSTVTLLSVAIVLYVSSLRNKKPLSDWMIILLAIASGLAFASRYIDMAWIWALSVVLLMYWSAGWRKIMLFTGATLLLCLPVLYTHYRVFGSPMKTPYVLHTSQNDNATDQDLKAYNIRKIPNSFYGMFVSPKLAGNQNEDRRGFFALSFWLIASFALPFCLKGRQQKERWLLLGFYAVFIGHLLFYLAFRGSSPAALQFGGLHYFKMFWPYMVVFSTIVISYTINRFVVREEKPQNSKYRSAKIK